MAFELPSLPYADNALEPHYSANTFSFHHAKHHNAYVVNLNKLIDGTDLAGKSLEEIIMATAKDDSKAGVFNNSAQVWNHTFFWNSMAPNGGGRPSGALAAKIDEDFGSFDAFAEKFKASAVGRFGSGWTFLVVEGGTLKIVNTLNAGTPMTDGQTALLTIDVWEHAYYLDYQNRRPDYVQTFLDKLANWDFASANFDAA
ncbi:superoxide dismutase [Pelagibius sp. Alg239-R121]|uniref:superoxide dismutase n=1 Tax=Pelagibius sp. Alg239-R121 TaxID=2993448 RepID=UPI0024A6F865|nr:superoxide dismutase [Pelagibius sp. Alg239-R121]